jgi:hypothetical protein
MKASVDEVTIRPILAAFVLSIVLFIVWSLFDAQESKKVITLPVYPGAHQLERHYFKEGYTISFVTPDNPERVSAFFSNFLQSRKYQTESIPDQYLNVPGPDLPVFYCGSGIMSYGAREFVFQGDGFSLEYKTSQVVGRQPIITITVRRGLHHYTLKCGEM